MRSIVKMTHASAKKRPVERPVLNRNNIFEINAENAGMFVVTSNSKTKLRFEIKDILARKRECDSSWLILQAESLCRLAKENGNCSALVYAALETRNAIEQLFFDLAYLCRPASGFARKDWEACRKKGGVFHVFARFGHDYQKRIEFTQLCLSLEHDSPRVIAWDTKKLQKYWGKVSEFCHFQGISTETTEADFDVWLVKGIALVEEIFGYFESEMSRASSGVLRPETMQHEVKTAWEDFKCGRIDLSNLRTRLQIMQPVVQQRRMFNIVE